MQYWPESTAVVRQVAWLFGQLSYFSFSERSQLQALYMKSQSLKPLS